jgi:hypothetical protein
MIPIAGNNPAVAIESHAPSPPVTIRPKINEFPHTFPGIHSSYDWIIAPRKHPRRAPYLLWLAQ